MAEPAEKKTLQKLYAQRRENARRTRALEMSLKERERKQHTIRLIAYGLAVLDDLDQGVRTHDQLMKQLDRILKQNSHRIAVGLPVPEAKKSEGKSGDQ